MSNLRCIETLGGKYVHIDDFSRINNKLTEINKILMEYLTDIEDSNMETRYKLRALAVKHQVEKIEVEYE